MAKTATKSVSKKNEPAAGSPAAKAAAAKSYKYGVPDLAKKLGIKEASARVSLRNHEVPKAEGGVYGWNSQAELDSVAKSLKPEKK